MQETGKIKLGISIGDLNGIGCEVVLKTFEDSRMLDFCTPVIFASNKTISHQKTDLGFEVNYNGIQEASKAIDGKINVVNVGKKHLLSNMGSQQRRVKVCHTISQSRGRGTKKR